MKMRLPFANFPSVQTQAGGTPKHCPPALLAHRVKLPLLGAILIGFDFLHVVQAAPDLVIQDIWSSPDPLVLGQPYTFYARVVNQGDTTASAGFLSSQRVDFSLGGNIIGSAFYDDVEPSSNVVFSINATANASPFSSHQFRAVADADNRIAESNEVNNSRTVSWHFPLPVRKNSIGSTNLDYPNQPLVYPQLQSSL